MRTWFHVTFMLCFLVWGGRALAQAPDGYEKWQWLSSTCPDCDILMLSSAPELSSAKTQAFIRALTDNKAEIQRLYKVHGAEYNLLAQMAVGILGRESKFFTSPRYVLKEEFPWAVYFAKVMRSYATGSRVDPNSRGPTQIKVVPTKIARHFNITESDLDIPENAAVATMGFLIESLALLKAQINSRHLYHINQTNYVDYLPYIYFGARKSIWSGAARPESNSYVQEMKHYMEWVEIYERPKSESLILSIGQQK